METPCVLCFKEINNQTQVSFITSCNHMFHTSCLILWCTKFSSCPRCDEFIDLNFCAKCFTKITKYYDLIKMKPCGHMYHIDCVETNYCLHCNSCNNYREYKSIEYL